jgi:hypothetical protein
VYTGNIYVALRRVQYNNTNVTSAELRWSVLERYDDEIQGYFGALYVELRRRVLVLYCFPGYVYIYKG